MTQAHRLELPDVTLVAVDGTVHTEATEAALADAVKQVKFRHVLFLAPSRPGLHPRLYDECEWIEIAPLSLSGYNRFCLTELHHYVDTSHCLTIQNDSAIVNPVAWRDEWLLYDYIGAPWPVGHTGTTYRVGNSGFCLRSKRLLQATAKLPTDGYLWRGTPKPGCRDDVITCVMYRPQLEALGLRFAPVGVAARFAFELPIPEATALDGQFGVHHRRRRQGSSD